jgi:hypothetical protein
MPSPRTPATRWPSEADHRESPLIQAFPCLGSSSARHLDTKPSIAACATYIPSSSRMLIGSMINYSVYTLSFAAR